MQMSSVFISYSSVDRPTAVKLEEALKQAGYATWRDESRIDTDWSIEVAQALSSRDVLCLLWSANAKASQWVQHEWLTARALETRVIPVLLPNAPDLPAPLANAEGAPSGGETFDGLLALLERTPSARVKYDYTVLPPRSFLPFLPNPDFVGRNAELVELYLNLIGNLQSLGTRQAGLVGMGGSGKTQLAIEFGYRFSYAFDAGVYWIQAANSADWLAYLIELARDRLQLTVPDPTGPQSAKQYLFALQTYCKTNPRMLVIFDNVVDPSLLGSDQPLLGAGISLLTLGCGLLFTTRTSVQMPGVAQQAIGVLAPEPAYFLIAAKRAPRNANEQEEIRKICEAVGYLPLAIVLAGGYLHNYASVSIQDYLAELTSRTLDTVDFDPIPLSQVATRHANAVTATLRSQWDALADETAKRILRLACALQESAILPLARLALLCGPLPSRSAIDRPFERACRLLWSVSLIDSLPDGQSTRVHPLIRQFVIGQFAPDENTRFRFEASATLEAAYADLLRLAKEFESRGVEEILTDIRIASEWAPRATSLHRLEQLLDRERNHLASGFLIQLQHRAVSMGETQIADRAAAALAQSPVPWIRTEAVSEEEDPAWIRTLTGHEWPVTALTAHPDGRRCLSGSQDQKIFLWDIERSQIIRTLQGPNAQVTCLSRIWDARYILAGYSDASLILWDLEDGKVIRSWKHETPDNWSNVPELAKFNRANEVKSVCVSPDAKLAVSGVHSFRGHLVVWDLATGEKRATLEGHTNGVISLAMDASGSVLASGSWDHRILLWDLKTGQQLRALEAHSDGVGAVAFSPDGSLLASGSNDQKVIVWEVKSGAAVKTLAVHSGWVNAVLFLDNSRLLSASSDFTLKVTDIASGQAASTLRGHSGPVLSVAKMPDRSPILSGGGDRDIRLWDLVAKTTSGDPPGSSSPVRGLALDQEAQSLLSGTAGEFSTWAAGLKKTTSIPFSPGDYTIINVSQKSGRALLLSKAGDGILVWDLRESKWLWQMPVAPRARPVMSDDGRWAAAVWRGPDSQDKTAVALDVNSGQSKLLAGNQFAIMALAVSADGRRALTVDIAACVWELETGKLLRSFGAPFAVIKAAVDSRGQLALLGSADGKVTVWDLATGTLRATLGEGFRFVQAFAFNQDSSLALVCGDDESIHLFHTADGAKVATLVLGVSVTAVCMSQDTIFLGDATGRICSFRLSK